MPIPTVTMQEMLEAGVHFGHQTHKWNPKMKRFIFTEKSGIHIIDLSKTASALNEALTYLYNLANEGKKVLFVSTKSQTKQLLPEIAERCGMYSVHNRWLGGTLTNFKTIKKRTKRLRSLEEQQKVGAFEKYTKREAILLKREIEKLNNLFSGIKTMDNLPDVLFVVDTVRDDIAVKEAKMMGVPVVAIVDTNADPEAVEYPIPANDDAQKSLHLLLNLVADVITEATSRK